MRRAKKDEETSKGYLEERQIIDSIVTCEDAVLKDDELMEKYYPLVDQMYNEGGLTLVVKEFVP